MTLSRQVNNLIFRLVLCLVSSYVVIDGLWFVLVVGVLCAIVGCESFTMYTECFCLTMLEAILMLSTRHLSTCRDNLYPTSK